MSIEALMWAMNLAPVPLDKGGKPNPACAAVLVGMSNHAGSDGRNAFPSTEVLVRYSRLSERTVQTAIDRLADDGIITPGDPAVVAAYIKHGGRRTQIWDLDMSLVRSDLSTEDLWDVARMNPFLEPLIHRVLTSGNAAGVQSLHPSDSPGVQQLHPNVDNPAAEVQPLHPSPVENPPRGAAVAPHKPPGVQLTTGRGAAVAPKPDLKQEEKPPTSSAPSVDNPQEGRRTPPDHHTAEQLAALALANLGPPWRLDAGTRKRAIPKLAARLAAGWTVTEALAELTHSPDGIRKPGGVFMTRLDALPMEPPPPAARPPAPGAPARCTRPGHEHYELPCRGCVVDAKAAS